jgi:hypothetical protein
MGNFFSKNESLDQLKKHFKLEIKGKDECSFEGARRVFDDNTQAQFDEWLRSKNYNFTVDNNFVSGIFKYHIHKR